MTDLQTVTRRHATEALAVALADVLWGTGDDWPTDTDGELLDALRFWLAARHGTETPAHIEALADAARTAVDPDKQRIRVDELRAILTNAAAEADA